MKKLLAFILALIMLISILPISVLAEEFSGVLPQESKTVQFYTEDDSCTEEEFKEILSESFQSETSVKNFLSNPGLDSKGYHYTYLSGDFEKDVYNACYKTLKNGVYTASFKTNVLNGYRYNSTAYYNRFNYLKNKLFKAGWCFRYDNIKVSDPYTNSVGIDGKVTFNSNYIITSSTFKVVMKKHPYYQSSMSTVRDDRIKQIASIADAEPNVYKKMKRVYEEIIRNSYYDHRPEALSGTYAETSIFLYAHSSFGILNNGVGVCESYAKSFKLVCDYLDLAPCVLMSSKAHMWNAVYLDNKWYGIDATWDDPGDNNDVKYKYFLCVDPDIVDGSSTDHILDTGYITGPNYATSPYDPAKHIHSMSVIPYVAPTYTTEGRSMYYKCSLCKAIYSDAFGNNPITLSQTVIPKKDSSECTHNFKPSTSVTPATTKSSGKDSVLKCTYCELIYGKAETIPAIKSVSVSQSKYPCTGSAVHPSITAKDVKGNKISSKYYSVSYSSGCKKPGKYTATVKFKGKYKGTLKTSYKLYVPKVSLKSSASSTSAKVSWTKPKGADGYTVYSSSKRKLGTTKSSSYTVKKLQPGKTYKFYVKSYYKISGKTYYSDYSSVNAYTAPYAPKLKSTNTTDKIVISWAKPKGAYGYEIYGSDKKHLKTFYTTKINVISLSPGTKYTFYIRAFSKSGSKKVYSSYSKISDSTDAKFTESKVSLMKGESLSIKSKLKTAYSKISWSSSNKKVVTVSSNGVVTAKGSGSAKIYAKSGGHTASITVSVTSPSVNIKSSSITLKPYYSISAYASSTPHDATIYWKSSNENIAKVDANGKITGVSIGTATITAYITVNGKTYSDTCKIYVKTPMYSSDLGYKYSKVPNFSAAVGNESYCYKKEKSYDENGRDMRFFYYDRDTINWDGKLSTTLSIYQSYLEMNGFAYLGFNNDNTVARFYNEDLNGGTYVMIMFYSDDIVIAVY